MPPNGIAYNKSIGSKQDWSYNMDIKKISEWLGDKRHNIRAVIFNTGTHYNSGQFGGGVSLDALLHIYSLSMEYISETLAKHLRNDQIAIFRASVSGHSDGNGTCSLKMHLNDKVRIKYSEYNWHGQEVLNAIWKVFLSEKHLQNSFPGIKYLDISRPTMLRPDTVCL
jgi:hypothetical protein